MYEVTGDCPAPSTHYLTVGIASSPLYCADKSQFKTTIEQTVEGLRKQTRGKHGMDVTLLYFATLSRQNVLLANFPNVGFM